jgi:hypothetical protein
MKPWHLLIGIGILAILCSPVLAISSADLISRYQAGGFWESPMPTPTQTPFWKGETGSISVWSDPPGAKVYLNGQFKGTTGTMPIIIRGVEVTYPFCDTVKSHQIKLTRAGYQDHTTMITVTAGETTSIVATLTPISLPSFVVPPTGIPTTVPPIAPTQVPTGTGTGTVSVSSIPTGARVYLDGVDRGTTPTTITGVFAGLHRLKVTLSGYHDYSTGVVVQSGKTATVFITQLRPVIPDEYEDSSYTDFISDVPSKKPNIYLYSDRDLTACVRLSPETAITASEPVYQPGMGWRAEIRNGSLNGEGDFLFYEALVPDSGWQKKEGYVIRASYRGQDMASMLGEYGFNKKEAVEFIDYWASHLLGDVDYVLYPQETDAVDRAMPLYISPEPDEVMRIWFYAEPSVSAPEPVTCPEKIVREGFYVVEWGVLIKDEWKILPG